MLSVIRGNLLRKTYAVVFAGSWNDSQVQNPEWFWTRAEAEARAYEFNQSSDRDVWNYPIAHIHDLNKYRPE